MKISDIDVRDLVAFDKNSGDILFKLTELTDVHMECELSDENAEKIRRLNDEPVTFSVGGV